VRGLSPRSSFRHDTHLCASTSFVRDFPMSAISTSQPVLSRPLVLQKDDSEHEDASEQEYDGEDEDAGEEDMVFESDSARFVSVSGSRSNTDLSPVPSSSYVFASLTPSFSTASPNSPVSRTVIPRLNPDAPPFIPRLAFPLSPVPVPVAEVRPPLSVSDSDVDGVNSAVKQVDERFVLALPDSSHKLI
jgi:hypothetical protein